VAKAIVAPGGIPASRSNGLTDGRPRAIVEILRDTKADLPDTFI
jgi:hypothetical protein